MESVLLNSLLRRLFGSSSAMSPWDTDAIIRDELFSVERLEQHATTLAQAQSVTSQPPARRSLNARLAQNEAVLRDAYQSIATAVGQGSAITPAAEWLLDNYHLVEEQIRKVQSDLSESYYRQLPKLASGPFIGYPRVFGIAWACIAHSDSRFDAEALRRFVCAYQKVQPLTIGELWAVAITLRIVLVENLRRVASRIVSSRAAREHADQIADRLFGLKEEVKDPAALLHHGDTNATLHASFVVQLVKRLRDQDPRLTPALVWLEARLAAEGTTSDDMVHDEHQRQAAANVTVRNIITSMRLISDVDWAEFFEDTSLVDAELRAGSEFASLDRSTRNLYRSVVEELSRGSAHSELDITRALIAAANSSDAGLRGKDPGYHLLGRGRPALDRALGYRVPMHLWPARLNASLGPGGYIGVVLLVAAGIVVLPLWALSTLGVSGWPHMVLAVLGLIPAIDVAVALVNRAVTRGFGASMLPGLALQSGVPAHLRTMVVVPTLLTSAAEIETQIERLEVHFLASAEGELHFALLSDWRDAATETADEDDALWRLASAGIARLNQMHPAPDGARFHLFHRRRVWSENQQHWMGWERKRGKLHELNRLLRGATDTTFMNVDPNHVPAGVRYVVTLDADTRLPREAVRRLVGKMAHPLNEPRFDAASGRVVEGYAVLQPRVTPSLPTGREGSAFQRIFSSMTGIDPYDSAVSDVYQDLFGEGSYAGKGIYDIDAFEAALADRVPEASLLSHDLFEGTFARAGLVSDIEVVEEFPSRYDVAAARNHRWVRGDWQLLPWILGRRDCAGRGQQRKGSGLPLIARWKMIDNLRRSLSAPACILALLAGWLLPLHAAWMWTAFVLATIALPIMLPVLAAILPRVGVVARSHLNSLGGDLRLALTQFLLTITFLAHQAWLMIDAIVRTLYRLLVSRRQLLEWVTAAQTQLSSRPGLAGAYGRMAPSVAIAIIAALVVAYVGFDAWMIALPFVLLWVAAPAIARYISVSPLIAGRLAVSADDSNALRLIARRTWRYFENFVTVEDHWLPPDNFQEDPQPVTAHRTSPTNMGLYLLCVVNARDFGWLGTAEVVERLERTLSTMQRLSRFRGHFFNWYDTRDLRPLEPQYVSAVDSGNLAAHLIAVANACEERTGFGSAVHIAGIRDAMQLLRTTLRELPDEKRTEGTTRQHLHELLNVIAGSLQLTCTSDERRSQLAFLVAQAATLADSARALASEQNDAAHGDMLFWAEAIQCSIQSWSDEFGATDDATAALHQRLRQIASDARAMALAMEFDFLLVPDRKLLSIGYRPADGTLDPSCYDLLASEARLASFFAIAKNDVPTRHWFRLGRAVTAIGTGAALISWSGSMFEYLMPSLVMRAPAGSLLERTNQLIVRRQISYGASRNVPWGVSESAYGARDLEFTYQYSNFGVPGLGLKRGLGENIVIAPYATGLAAMVDPQAATRNFARLSALGALGRFGFYEALDFTRSRVPEGAEFSVVRAFMAHHQGMTLVAIGNVLFDGRMRERFHAESSIQATELLLQERTPRHVPVTHPRAEEVKSSARLSSDQPEVRRLRGVHYPTPQTHLLSNGRYAVMLTHAGSGYSRWGDTAVTRWREDTTRDDSGSYIFLRDVNSGAVWSAGYQPSGVEPDSYQVTFMEDRAEFIRTDAELTTVMEVVVSPEDDAEVRRLSITNAGALDRDLDITSYCELVLASPAADAAHPAFSKMFVQTQYVTQVGVLLATRRRRTPGEAEIWLAHHCVVEGEELRAVEYETDRALFLGRGRELHEPIAVMDGRRLSNTVGTVLDPIFALRHRVRVPAGGAVRLSFWTGAASLRSSVLDLFDKHNEANSFARAAMLAWTQAQVQLHHLSVTAEEANLYQRLAGHVLYADSSLRLPAVLIARSNASRAALWAQGISGDVPIVLLRIDGVEDIGIARQLLQAHEYWQLKGLAVDLVILNERAASYEQDLQVGLETMVRTSRIRPPLGSVKGTARGSTRGSIFVLRSDTTAVETRDALHVGARAMFVGAKGTLAEQLDRRTTARSVAAVTTRIRPEAQIQVSVQAPLDVEFFNGLGGFAADGREYVTTLEPGQSTPAPWINVITNPHFGFQVAVEGGGYTWSINSRENQLTQWSNDPVTDRPGEVLYIRDDDTNELWGPTATPMRSATAPYSARHGQGYSRFEHTAHDIALDLLVYVPVLDSIKISRLRIRNDSQRMRRLSVAGYVEWVMGTTRGATAPYVITQMDTVTGAMFATHSWSAGFATRVAFADLSGRQSQWTGDRREFLGRHGRLDQPAALASGEPLSGLVGAALDPCCALLTSIELEPGASTEVVFLLGEAGSAGEAQALLARYRAADLDAVLSAVTEQWDQVLETLQVSTPDRSMDIMLNRWMLYQTLACRIWARSAFYQASGAYGFRDQLQDGMAIVTSKPAITREHLLRAAGRQFAEGDVQHWWLPPLGQGVRTHISDDRIWLAHAAMHYIDTTGDRLILDEAVTFIEGPLLDPHQHDAYFQPSTAANNASFFEHCARGLDASLALGAHGLPLIGTGDWNDGMNRVGEQGRGESIWLGWFLHATLTAFAKVAAACNETDRSGRWLAHAETLRASLEREGWDGQWYRRGYYDDGTALGSAESQECRIDSIAQSWSVISNAADPIRASQAMRAVETQLIRPDDGLALLFTPPFDHTELDPGYIKGYPPGLRENGGQYTHAAAWSVIAFAKLGRGDAATQLFSLLNPINRTSTRTNLRRYKVEPYVVAADVYSVAPHVGRGGWTWYTGSAGWMYRAGIESILGFQLRGDHFLVNPCIPEHWPRFELTFRHRSTRYEIVVENPNRCTRGVVEIRVDGELLPAGALKIALLDDGLTHLVLITMGTRVFPAVSAESTEAAAVRTVSSIN